MIVYFASVSIIFFLIRIALINSSLTLDETEILHTKEAPWSLTYHNQAPLYVWLVKSISYFTEINLISLSFIKYSLYFAFWFTNYLISRNFWSKANSFYISLFTVFIVQYSYESNFDLTHSILLSFLSSLFILQLIRTIKSPSWLNYLALAIIAALAFLSKYNFILLLLASVFALAFNLSLRKRLLNIKLIVSALLFLSLISIHLLAYANHLEQGLFYFTDNAVSLSIFNNYIQVAKILVIKYFVVFIPVLVVFGLFFRGRILASRIYFIDYLQNIFGFSESKPSRKNNIIQYLSSICLISFILPIIYVFYSHIDKFQGRWGMFFYFFFVQIMFLGLYRSYAINLKQEIPFHNKKTLIVIVSLFFTIVASLKLCFFYKPDLFKVYKRETIPFYHLVKQLDKSLSITAHRHTATNINYHLEQLGVSDHKEAIRFKEFFDGEYKLAKDQTNYNSGKSIQLIWNMKRYGKQIPQELLDLSHKYNCLQKNIEIIKIPYLNSRKNFKFALIVCQS